MWPRFSMLGEKPIRVCHVASGDLWAGAEAQIASLLCAVKADPDYELSVVVLNQGRLAQEIAASAVPVTIFDESRSGPARILRELVSYLNFHKPDIVHSHRYKEHILSAFASKLSHNPILIQTFHGLDEQLRGWAAVKMRAYSWFNTRVGNWAAHGFIGVSEDITEVLRRRYRSRQVRCIRNGIDLARVRSAIGRDTMRDRLDLPADAFLVGAVGRLTPIKGIEYLIRAWASTARKFAYRNGKLVIVGDGPTKPSLETLARDLGVGGDTVFLGNRTDVYDVIGMLDVLALPSLHEGIPMVLLEAMALRIPIVASSVGGVPEILTDKREALLVPARDANALAGAIEGLAYDASMRSRLREAARARVQAQLSIEVTAAHTCKLYRQLMPSASVRA